MRPWYRLRCSWQQSWQRFWYLRAEEVDRDQQALKRDVEYAQQRMRLRLLERQEQVMRIARDLAYGDIGTAEFVNRAEALITPVPRAAGSDLGRP